MKIILKHNYSNITKQFNDKEEMIDYINNNLSYKEGCPINNNSDIYDLISDYFADYHLVKESKDTNLNIRMNSELLEKLKDQALKENRTLSNLVETILKDYLNRRGDKE